MGRGGGARLVAAPGVAQLDQPRLAKQAGAQLQARDEAELARVEDRVGVRAHLRIGGD